MKVSPTLRLRIALRDVEAQVRRLGVEYRAKQRGDRHDGAAAEVAALHHLAEARSALERLSEPTRV